MSKRASRNAVKYHSNFNSPLYDDPVDREIWSKKSVYTSYRSGYSRKTMNFFSENEKLFYGLWKSFAKRGRNRNSSSYQKECQSALNYLYYINFQEDQNRVIGEVIRIANQDKSQDFLSCLIELF